MFDITAVTLGDRLGASRKGDRGGRGCGSVPAERGGGGGGGAEAPLSS